MIIFLGILAIAVIWLIATYNFFATAKTRIDASFQEISNQLKRQVDLIPNLEASARGYLKHEKGIFNELSSARKQIGEAAKSQNFEKMADAGKTLSDLLPKIQVAVEDNPELKGNDVVKGLMEELRDTSDKIMYARRLMIDLTADYNIKTVTFPTSLVAEMFKFKKLPGFDTKVSQETPKINL